MNEFFEFLILALVVARVTRFVVLDELIAGTRDRVIFWLQLRVDEDLELPPSRSQRIKQKISILLECPWCVSIYVAAVVVLIHLFGPFVDPLPLPVWYWLALSMAAVILIEIVDGVKQVRQVNE